MSELRRGPERRATPPRPLFRKGLRVVTSRYYTGRRLPSTRLFESTDNKLRSRNWADITAGQNGFRFFLRLSGTDLGSLERANEDPP
jgi:hypothetical protein